MGECFTRLIIRVILVNSNRIADPSSVCGSGLASFGERRLGFSATTVPNGCVLYYYIRTEHGTIRHHSRIDSHLWYTVIMRILRMAWSCFELGIVRGEAIGLLCDNCPEWVSCRTFHIRTGNSTVVNRIRHTRYQSKS